MMESKIVKEWTVDGIRCLVLRNKSGGHDWPTAYLGLPKKHPWSGKCAEKLRVQPHGGWTHQGKLRDITGFWIGWDYAHLCDATRDSEDGHRWTDAEVVAETERIVLKACQAQKRAR